MSIKERARKACEGQAMVEFIVSLVAILIVAAGMFLLAELIRVDTETSVAATGEAISGSMSLGMATSFTPIEDWDPGADGMRHTKDDRPQRGNFGRVRRNVTAYTAPSGDWSGTRRLDGGATRYADIVQFHDGVLSGSTMRFMRGRSEQTVETIPVMQSLMGLPPTLTLRNEVWMPSTGELY